MARETRISMLETHLGYWLRMVSNHVSHAFSRRIAAADVTVAEWVVLRTLYPADSVTPSRVADELKMTRGAISKLVDRLVAKDLVSRTVSQGDRRWQDIALRPKGRALVPRLAALATRTTGNSSARSRPTNAPRSSASSGRSFGSARSQPCRSIDRPNRRRRKWTAKSRALSRSAPNCRGGDGQIPEIVGRLTARRRRTLSRRSQAERKTYYLPNGDTHVTAAETVKSPFADVFDPAAVAAAVRASQVNGIDYSEFLARIAAAGCIEYTVSIAGRRALYIGRRGDHYTEYFPSAA